MKILAETSVPYLRGVIEDIGQVTYLPSEEFTPDTVRDKDWLIVRSITKCRAELLDGSAVKLITTATIGYDHIDIDFCRSHGIEWSNAPGCNAEAVGQWFGSVVSKLILEQGYDPREHCLGIVGVGHVGAVIQRYAMLLGFRVLLNDPPRQEREGGGDFVALEEIARECDVITFHVPLVRSGKHSTVHLCGKEFIEKLARKPLLINACRGPVCDTDALLCGLSDGKIQGVVMDCWENEPGISPELLSKAWVATPHIAGFSADGKCNGARACVQKGMEYFGVHTPLITRMTPPRPLFPQIDLNSFPDHRIARALLHTLNLTRTDSRLRQQVEPFEYLRRTYEYPREPRAYTIKGYTQKEKSVLEGIGFLLG